MALRADQWLMIGVGGLGAYALYRLMTTKPDQGGSDQGGSETPILGTQTTTAPPGTFEFSQNMLYAGPDQPPRTQIRLTPNWYRGRIEVHPAGTKFGMQLPRPARPFEFTTADAPREEIVRELQVLGFDPVRVFMANDAQIDIPLPALIQNPTAQSRWFYGRWNRPAGSMLAVPSTLKAIIPSEEPARPRTAGHYGYGPRYALQPFRYL